MLVRSDDRIFLEAATAVARLCGSYEHLAVAVDRDSKRSTGLAPPKESSKELAF